MAEPTTLIGRDGRKYTIDDPANIAAATKLGYRVETPEAPQTFGEQAKGAFTTADEAAQGAAPKFVSGLTAGASDIATPTDLNDKRDVFRAAQVKRFQEEHPIVTGAADVAGMIASPINKIAAPIEGAIGATTALGRIGASAAGQAAVGSLQGAGNTLSEAALGDHQLTAEQLIAGAGLGALLGSAGGGIGTAVGEAAGKVLPKLGKSVEGAQDSLKEFADQRWIKASAATKGQIGKVPEVERPAVADVIREHMGATGDKEKALESIGKSRDILSDHALEKIGVGDAGGLKAGMNNEDAVAALNKGFEHNGNAINDVLGSPEAMAATPSYQKILKRVEDYEGGLDLAQKDIAKSDIQKIKDYMYTMGSEPVVSPKNNFQAINKIKGTLQKDINYVADSGAKNDVKKALVGILRDEIDTQIAPQIGSDLSKKFLDAKEAYGALKEAAKSLRAKSSTGQDAIEALVKNSTNKITDTETKALSALNHAHDLVAHGLEQKNNRWLSPTDYMTGIGTGIATGNPMGVLHGLVGAIGHKVLRERGSAVIGTLADKIANSPALAATAASFAKRVTAAAPQMGAVARPVLQSLAQSPAHALATHMTMAHADPQYAQAAQAAGFVPETADQHGAALVKAHGIASVAAAVNAHNEEMDKHIDRVIKGAGTARAPKAMASQDFGAKRMRQDGVAAHNKRAEEARALAANPEELINRTTANLGNISHVAPGVAAQMTSVANRAVQYLSQASAHPPKAGPLAADYVPSIAEQHAFAKKVEVVQDPMSTMRHAAAGTLTLEQMQTLQAVYPTLARSIADKTMMRMADSPKSVPYRSRLMLGLLTGTDPDGTIGLTASNQAAITANSGKPSNAGADSGSKDSKLTVAARTATPEQRRQLKED